MESQDQKHCFNSATGFGLALNPGSHDLWTVLTMARSIGSCDTDAYATSCTHAYADRKHSSCLPNQLCNKAFLENSVLWTTMRSTDEQVCIKDRSSTVLGTISALQCALSGILSVLPRIGSMCKLWSYSAAVLKLFSPCVSGHPTVKKFRKNNKNTRG